MEWREGRKKGERRKKNKKQKRTIWTGQDGVLAFPPLAPHTKIILRVHLYSSSKKVEIDLPTVCHCTLFFLNLKLENFPCVCMRAGRGFFIGKKKKEKGERERERYVQRLCFYIYEFPATSQCRKKRKGKKKKKYRGVRRRRTRVAR